MSARVKRELQVAVLSGSEDTVREYVRKQILAGLTVFRELMLSNRTAVDAALTSRSKRAQAIRHKLPYGWVVELNLQKGVPFAYMRPPRSKARAVFPKPAPRGRLPLEPGGAVKQLPEELCLRVKTDVDALLALLVFLDRARRQVLTLVEEGTRWRAVKALAGGD